TMLIGIDVALASLSLWLAAMNLVGVDSVNAYLAVATLIGVANAFEMPVRQTLIRDIVEERSVISSALGVSAMVFNLGRMIRPAIAGALLIYVTEAWCFVLNALSYSAIIAALLAMRLPRASAPAGFGTQSDGFRANLSVLMSFPAVRYLL